MIEDRNDFTATDSSRYLVVLDVDSTLIENEAIELLAEEAGSLELVAAVTERAMRGELDFAESLRERVATLAGLPSSVFETVRSRITVTAGAEILIKRIQELGGTVGVVSGGFHELLDPLAQQLGLDKWKANRLEVVEGVLTGNLVGEIIDADAKADALRQWAQETSIPLSQTVAIGDGANDLKMMEVAALGIAFCAKPIVQESADVALNERDLSKALGLIGL
ncbi:phosphoserine phosphatase SerB [Aurantimicrobium sp. MWH-Uga1]|uniref:phosphoserine phosphatase SerB n=1 Tax=Aurantimicrobium sp. MWH-Uga1 TaxID=2079575 RepID=UPI000DED6E18|nr:phosphoserine phosphatase SerB [Aurantimicrobium sp. MWH-Uga1]AXE54469.1 Phosphoserine phosphatase [Aurantimicrobium sp. MWH-Uga1]